MNEQDYIELIPYFCTFPHITKDPEGGDVCWGITNRLVTRMNYCDGCYFSPMAGRKIDFWAVNGSDQNRLGIWRW